MGCVVQSSEEIKVWRDVLALPSSLEYDSERRVAQVEAQKRLVENEKVATRGR